MFGTPMLSVIPGFAVVQQLRWADSLSNPVTGFSPNNLALVVETRNALIDTCSVYMTLISNKYKAVVQFGAISQMQKHAVGLR